nr:hypothetical protein [Arthrobacter cheniae]
MLDDTAAVVDLVQRQKDLGITIPGDGEYGKAMSNAEDYGAWWTYSFQRTAGLELTDFDPILAEPVRSEPGAIRLTSFADRRDWTRFASAYQDPESGIQIGRNATAFPSATGPISYTGQAALDSDIANLKAGLETANIPTGFITALSPGSASRIGNDYYASEEEFIYAWADVLREEYRAIVDAGLIVQIDDPSIAENWDQINPEPSIEDYQRFTQIRVDALNYALEGLPEDQIRFQDISLPAGKVLVPEKPVKFGPAFQGEAVLGECPGRVRCNEFRCAGQGTRVAGVDAIECHDAVPFHRSCH